jgi:hypothetical protein
MNQPELTRQREDFETIDKSNSEIKNLSKGENVEHRFFQPLT